MRLMGRPHYLTARMPWEAALDEEALRWLATRTPVERDELLAPIRLLEVRRKVRELLAALERDALAVRRNDLTDWLRAHPFCAPPWWSPLPESITGVLRAWWRRWMSTC